MPFVDTEFEKRRQQIFGKTKAPTLQPIQITAGGFADPTFEQRRQQVLTEKPKVITTTKKVTVATPKAPENPIQNAISNIVKGINLTFVNPTKSTVQPSAPTTKVTQINIKPGQEKLSSSQLKKISPQKSKPKDPVSEVIDGIKSTVTKLFPQTSSAVGSLAADPLSLKADPTKFIDKAWQAIKDPVIEEVKRVGDLFTKTPTTSQKVGKGLEVVAGGAGVVFSPIGAIFAGAETVPVLGSLGKLLTLPFLVIGEGAPQISNGIIDQLPLSKQVKANIKPGVGEITALAGQLLLGKVSEVGMKKIKVDLTERFGAKDAKTIIKTATELAEQRKAYQNATSIKNLIKEGEHTPQELINSVLSNGQEKTAEGKALIKSAMDAQAEGKNINISKAAETAASKDAALISEYRSKFGKQLLNADNVRELYKPEGYNRINSADFHDAASSLTGKIFKEDLSKLQPGDKYMFTAGSSGAGKSSSFARYPDLMKDVAGGLDSNFSSKSAMDKLGQVIDKGGKPSIVFFYRDAIDAWKNGVVKRAIDPNNRRVVPAEIFFENLTESPKKVLEAYKKYGDKVDVTVIDNSLGKGKQIKVKNPIDFLENIKYNLDDVKKQVISSTQQGIKDGTISPETGKALLGRYSQENGQITSSGNASRLSSTVKTVSKEAVNQASNATNVSPKKTVEVPRSNLPVGSGKEKVSKLESRIQSTIKGASQEVIDKLGSVYNQMNKKENIASAAEYVTKNPTEALKVLTGEIEAPKGILRNSVYVAMENLAKGDVGLARKLASLQSTRYGQELSILTELDPTSPVRAMSDIVNVREKAFKERYKSRTKAEVQSKVVDQIKSKVKKVDKYDWKNFINSIDTC